MGYFFIFLNILLISTSQVLIKMGVANLDMSNGPHTFLSLFNVYIYSSIVLLVLALLAWFAALSKFPLSHAYPFVGLVFPLVLLLSKLVLNERVSHMQWVGVCIVCIGLILLFRSQ